jgi:hypothetical protein
MSCGAPAGRRYPGLLVMRSQAAPSSRFPELFCRSFSFASVRTQLAARREVCSAHPHRRARRPALLLGSPKIQIVQAGLTLSENTNKPRYFLGVKIQAASRLRKKDFRSLLSLSLLSLP